MSVTCPPDEPPRGVARPPANARVHHAEAPAAPRRPARATPGPRACTAVAEHGPPRACGSIPPPPGRASAASAASAIGLGTTQCSQPASQPGPSQPPRRGQWRSMPRGIAPNRSAFLFIPEQIGAGPSEAARSTPRPRAGKGAAAERRRPSGGGPL